MSAAQVGTLLCVFGREWHLIDKDIDQIYQMKTTAAIYYYYVCV